MQTHLECFAQVLWSSIWFVIDCKIDKAKDSLLSTHRKELRKHVQACALKVNKLRAKLSPLKEVFNSTSVTPSKQSPGLSRHCKASYQRRKGHSMSNLAMPITYKNIIVIVYILSEHLIISSFVAYICYHLCCQHYYLELLGWGYENRYGADLVRS